MNLLAPVAEVPAHADRAGVLNDRRRVAALSALALPDRAVFDHLAAVTAAVLGCDIAFACLIEPERQTIIGAHALGSSGWAPLDGFCVDTLAIGEPLMVGEIADDPVAATRPAAADGYRAYAGACLRSHGERVGTLSGLHHRARAWTIADAQRLASLAALASHLLEHPRRVGLTPR